MIVVLYSTMQRVGVGPLPYPKDMPRREEEPSLEAEGQCIPRAVVRVDGRPGTRPAHVELLKFPIRPQCFSWSWFVHLRYSYTIFIPVLGIDRKPSVWNCVTSPPSLKSLAGSQGLVFDIYSRLCF